MNRSSLEHKFYKCQTTENHQAYKKQKNYCNRLYKRERKKYYTNLDLKMITDKQNSGVQLSLYFQTKGEGGIILYLSMVIKLFLTTARLQILLMISLKTLLHH